MKNDKVTFLHDRWSLSELIDFQNRKSSERNSALIKETAELNKRLEELLEKENGRNE